MIKKKSPRKAAPVVYENSMDLQNPSLHYVAIAEDEVEQATGRPLAKILELIEMKRLEHIRFACAILTLDTATLSNIRTNAGNRWPSDLENIHAADVVLTRDELSDLCRGARTGIDAKRIKKRDGFVLVDPAFASELYTARELDGRETRRVKQGAADHIAIC